MAEELAPYTDRCGVCGTMWRRFDKGIKKLEENTVQCVCGARFQVTKYVIMSLEGKPPKYTADEYKRDHKHDSEKKAKPIDERTVVSVGGRSMRLSGMCGREVACRSTGQWKCNKCPAKRGDRSTRKGSGPRNRGSSSGHIRNRSEVGSVPRNKLPTALTRSHNINTNSGGSK